MNRIWIAGIATGSCCLAALLASDAIGRITTHGVNLAPADAPGSIVAPADAPGSIVAIAPMSAVRMAHTATSLLDGRVLVAGGFTGEADAARSAEVYDPAAGRFLPLPRMITPRHSHTATRLANGKVLIVGGYAASSTPVSSAELFDPATGSFAPAGALAAPRAGHIATLLSDGRVLVAGGLGPAWTFLSSAELYDPATGRFTSTGAMTVARESHVAVRLQDGRVLVVGGHRGRREDITLYTSTEAYDPSSGTFKPAGDMRTRRHKHDAVLLADGRVLVTGGSDERDGDGSYDSTELYDPRTDAFSAGPRMQRARYKHQGSAVLMSDGRVLVAGGATEAEVYDPSSTSFALVPGAVRLTGQFSAVAALGNGNVLLTGGYGDGVAPGASASLYRNP